MNRYENMAGVGTNFRMCLISTFIKSIISGDVSCATTSLDMIKMHLGVNSGVYFVASGAFMDVYYNSMRD